MILRRKEHYYFTSKCPQPHPKAIRELEMATSISTSTTTSCHLCIEDFNSVAVVCQSVSHKWEELAKHLKIDRDKVLSIRKDFKETPQCLDELLTVWLRQTSKDQRLIPSWRSLCDAIAKIDNPLSKKVWTDHIKECGLCKGVRTTPVATAVHQNNAKLAAKELRTLFDELLNFLIVEIKSVNADILRLNLAQFFKREEEVNDETSQHLMRIEDCPHSAAVLNYFILNGFIGYINYSLIKVFQQLAKSPMLDKCIEEYEKDYQCFLELSFSQIHDAFQQCPDLQPNYPAGIPKFTIHLRSKWEGKSMFEFKEFLKKCLSNSDCIDQLMIAEISRNCIIISFAVLPHIAKKVIKYLTNDDVIMTMKEEGMIIEISDHLVKYKEAELKSEPVAPTIDVQLKTTNQIKDLLSQRSFNESENQKHQDHNHDSLTTQNKLKTDQIEGLRKERNIMENRIQELLKKLEKEKFEKNFARMLADERDRSNDFMREALSRMRAYCRKLQPQISEEDYQQLNSLLLEKAKAGDVNEMCDLALRGADINCTDQKNQTPLHVASKVGHTDVVRVLLSHGAKVDVKNSKGGLTSLHLASKNGHTEIVNILLSYGATINIKENIELQTPLHLAAIRGNTEVAQELLIHGASSSLEADRRQTPLHRASENGRVEIVRLLIEYKATVNAKNQFGNTPLHLASRKGATDIVKLLVESSKVDIDDLNNEFRSPLHEACQRGRTEVVKLLMSFEASINMKDQHDQSPLHTALLQGHIDTAMVLLSAGADISVKDKYGQTPVLIAVVLKLEDVLKFIQSNNGVTQEEIEKQYKVPLGQEAVLDDEKIQIIYRKL